MSAWMPTITGRALVFAEPVFEPDHLWTEIAPALAKIARFTGHTDIAYSVAQHSVLMAEAAMDETGDPLLAAHCLLHDAHEAFTGDRTTPMKEAIVEAVVWQARASALSDTETVRTVMMVNIAQKIVEMDLDEAIFRAARMTPPDQRVDALVEQYDIRALATERRDLLMPSTQRWRAEVEAAKPLRLRKGRIRPWPAGQAETRFAEALTLFCPDAASACGRGVRDLEGAA